MPIVASEIPETYLSITRPVTVNLVRDLVNRFNLPNDTNVFYSGSAGTFANDGSTLASKNSDPVFQYEGKVSVDVEEEYLEDYVLNSSVKKANNIEIFTDKDLDIHIYPAYTKVRNILTFSYTTSSKRELEKARDRLKRKISEGMQTLLHEIEYHYSLPYSFYSLLKELYNKRESNEGYGDTYHEWLSKNFDLRMTVLSNMDGTRGIASIMEKQILVQGWFDFTVSPEKSEKTESGDLWELTFSYTIEYDKVTSMAFKYPILVHNQLISTDFIPNLDPYYDPYDRERRPSHTGSLSEFFSVLNYDKNNIPYKGVIIPGYDDWEPPVNKNTLPILRALVGVEVDDPNIVLDLNQLGEYSISEAIMNFIRQHRTRVLDYLSNPLLIRFYKNGTLQDKSNVYIDENLVLRSIEPLNPRDVHRVELSILKNLRLLRRDAVDTLLNNPDICFRLIGFLDNILGDNELNPIQKGLASKTSNTKDYSSRSKFPRRNANVKRQSNVVYPYENTAGYNNLVSYLKVIGNKLVTRASFEDVVSRINIGVDLSTVGQGRGLHTVMQSGIIVHKT